MSFCFYLDVKLGFGSVCNIIDSSPNDVNLMSELFVMQRHFVEVTAKFSKFQRPADFDTKLTHVKRVLDDIDQRLHLIELTSSDMESVQNKLDQCTVSTL